ncbi:MAG: vWA domain-containing protein [Vulcanimicrobiaceae bacterium]
MSFAHPFGLVAALLAAAALAWLYRSLERRRRAQALLYSNVAFALEAMRPARWPALMLFAAFVLAVAALLGALAGPRFTARVPAKDGSVVICIDTSGSMRATDLQPSREAAAKSAALAFIDAVPEGTRIGLISFSSGANVIQAPTSDLDVVREAIDRIPPADGATAIGDALTLAAAQMPSGGRRVIVLLTDGVNNRGVDPVEASQAIGQKGIAIYTVGVGTTNSGELIPGTSELADLDEGALRSIAANANGTYAQAGDAGSLSGTFRHIAFETVWENRRVDGTVPFALGGGLLLLATFLVGFGLGRFP